MENNTINTEFADAFKARTKKQAVSIIKFLKNIKSNEEIMVIKNQLIKCCTSVAANYRAACRGRSKADFISKLGIVHEEADEVLFWLELLADLNYASPELEKLTKESDEILRVVAKSVATSRNNLVNSKNKTLTNSKN
ncbi:four helix bundle protein [Aurantibacillus circumpalustris]|uniref:four helix bundle protein n=1 Tax=Aurantibacillus circumpalustris TaxID=3036359 RepID=UPI00295AED74|nr:four helix bundle protein [Aurantibacillus circumpalustris]